ncbi:hypothetical protein LTR04_003152 [Oleoguttula sp. CCFEE 6159]|nr:hypothetical protein LTR04_003152 [Oleoguttula sp. CCFEE 6159]
MDYQQNTYSTTSYGAQGGAGGGGFMNTGSQNSPGSGAKQQYGKDTLRPVTIKQILDAQQPHPDAEFKVDGSEITQVTFVGQIRNISTQTTNITYKLDDGTGTVEVKQWIDSDATSAMDTTDDSKPKLAENAYARVLGRLKAFNNKRHVGAHVIKPINDYNEIQCHLLGATVVHLHFTRGPPQSLNKGGAANGAYGQQDGGAAGGDYGGGPLPNTLSGAARKVYNLLKTAPQTNEGLQAQVIAVQLNMPTADVVKAGDDLVGQGLIYTTVDEHTWAVLDV